MNKIFALLMMSLFITTSALAQRAQRHDERIQTTYINNKNVDLGQWLRIHPADYYQTEILDLTITGASFVTNKGTVDILVNNRLFQRFSFKRLPSGQRVVFHPGTRLHQVTVHINGEVYVDSVSSVVIERRFDPPRPIPPRYPAPAPRPVPPRHEPAPRPRHPRHEPAPRPTPPRHTPAPRPGAPRPGGPGPRR